MDKRNYKERLNWSRFLLTQTPEALFKNYIHGRDFSALKVNYDDGFHKITLQCLIEIERDMPLFSLKFLMF